MITQWTARFRSAPRRLEPFFDQELRRERIHEAHALQNRPITKVFTEHNRHLVQAGRRLDMGVVVGKFVITDAPPRFHHNHSAWGTKFKI